jgi:activator of HSP90 ATPase
MSALKTINQEITFKAEPEEVYEALVNPEQHAAFTGSPATITPKAEGRFSAYDGYITGTNVKLNLGKELVQRWRATDWPPGHYSTVTFSLKKVQRHTELHFAQTGVPAQFYKDTNAGWKSFYWDKMKKYFSW